MFNAPISTAFMILALILAVVAGLWFGSVLGDSAAGRDQERKDGQPPRRRSFGKALQATATSLAIKAWKWQRGRAKQRAQQDRETGN